MDVPSNDTGLSNTYINPTVPDSPRRTTLHEITFESFGEFIYNNNSDNLIIVVDADYSYSDH